MLGIGLFIAFANLIEPKIMESSEQVGLVVLFWAFLPLAVALCLGLGFAMSEQERG